MTTPARWTIEVMIETPRGLVRHSKAFDPELIQYSNGNPLAWIVNEMQAEVNHFALVDIPQPGPNQPAPHSHQDRENGQRSRIRPPLP